MMKPVGRGENGDPRGAISTRGCRRGASLLRELLIRGFSRWASPTVLNYGQVLAEGEPAAIRENADVRRVYLRD